MWRSRKRRAPNRDTETAGSAPALPNWSVCGSRCGVFVAAGVPPAVAGGILPPGPASGFQPDSQLFQQSSRTGVRFSAGRDARRFGRRDACRYSKMRILMRRWDARPSRSAPVLGRGNESMPKGLGKPVRLGAIRRCCRAAQTSSPPRSPTRNPRPEFFILHTSYFIN